MFRRITPFLLVLALIVSEFGWEGSVPENFRFAPSLPTFRLGPSHSRGHGRPRFSWTLPSQLNTLAASSTPQSQRRPRFSWTLPSQPNTLAASSTPQSQRRPRFSGTLPSQQEARGISASNTLAASATPQGQKRPRLEGTIPSDRIKGDVIDTTSNDYAMFGLTDKGEIFWSRDGKEWTVIDFNEAYRGYYKPVRLVGIAAGNGNVAVVGTYEKTGAPAMFVSSRGNVWSERGLTYTQGEELFELTEAPLAIRADLERDEFVLTCTDGVLFFVPPCSHCNRKGYLGND